MKRKSFFMLVLAIQLLTMHAQTINRYIPDGWEWKNVSLNYGIVIKSTSTEEIAVVPPYYYANYAGEKVRGSAVVTEIQGYIPYNSGWMVKSLNLPFEKEEQSQNSVPSNIIPNLNAPTYAAFYNCTNMKKIVLPPTIKKIGALAFENCDLTELVCMAVTPPTLVETSFDKVSIGKIIVPKGTLQTYKATAGWNNFTIEEGAETYSNHQMVECNGAWYEVVNGEASLVNSDDLTDPIMPETVTCLIKGEWKTVPVTGIREWSVGRNITLNDNITDIPLNYGDNGKGIAFYVKDTHPTLRQLTKQVITNKKGNIAYYVFGKATVPHGVTAIANNALNYCTEVYLPTTLVSLGVQSTSATKYFTSAQPPSSSSSYGGYAPEEYLETYKASGYGSFYKSYIPAGYECLIGNNYRAYWHPQKNTCILKYYTVSVNDVDADGVITLPSQWYFSESANGNIDRYDLYIDKGNDVNNLHKIRIPEGIKSITSIIPLYNSSEYNIQEINLPSTLERCQGLSEIEGLLSININPNNNILDSRDNCNAVIETATNTLISACSTTIIPSTIEHICDSAFYRVQYTQDVLSIPASVKTIGKHAFQGISRTGWTSLQIEFSPSSQLTCIEDSAFYNSFFSKITLPESLVNIKNGVFANCDLLKEVSFGSNVKEIGEWAFRGCPLSSVVLPDALETIGDYAFIYIPTLEDVTFGKSLKIIGNNAFSGSSISQLVFPDALETIGDYAFGYMPTLETVTFGKSLKKIGQSAFSGSSISQLVFPDALETIGGHAFSSNVSLESVDFGKSSVTTIGDRTFYGCTGLTSVTIPSSVTSIGSSAFSGCSGLSSITIPSSVTTIGSYAFYECTGLTSVTINSNSISAYAFENCTNLSTATLGDGIKSIAKEAFYGCSALKTVTIDSEVACYASYYGEQVTEYIIGDNIKSIGASAFKNCRAKNITFGKGVEYIGKEAFDGSTWYNSQPNGVVYAGKVAYKYKGTMPSNTVIEIKEGTVSIGESAFNGCSGLISITIPNSAKGIGWYAFSNCTGLTSIDLPNSVTSIGHMAFSGCSSLTSITIPDGVTSISAFAGCTNLTSINIPNSITIIGYMAFSSCASLTSITIPNGVTSIGDSAFSHCTGLTSVYSYIENPTSNIGSSFYSSNYSNATLYVPYGTKDKYLATDGWKKFANIVEMSHEIEPIEDEIVIAFDDKDYIVDNTPVALNSTVINDMYISMDNKSDVNNPDGFYDSNNKCIVINKVTSSSAIATAVESELGSSDFINNYTGMVIEVNGKGSVKINAQTVGNNKLAVKIGNSEAKTFAKATKGDVVVNYDVSENAYVYIYATDGDNQAQSLSMSTTASVADNAVKIFSITVMPEVTAVGKVTSAMLESALSKMYSLDGKQLASPQKGINILKMSDGTTRKVVK